MGYFSPKRHPFDSVKDFSLFISNLPMSFNNAEFKLIIITFSFQWDETA